MANLADREERLARAVEALRLARNAIEDMYNEEIEELEQRCEGKFTLPRLLKEARAMQELGLEEE